MIFRLVSHSREKRLLPSICPSVRPSAFLSVRPSSYMSANPSRRISVKFGIGHFYENLSRKLPIVARRRQKFWVFASRHKQILLLPVRLRGHYSALLASKAVSKNYVGRRRVNISESPTVLYFVHCLCCLSKTWTDHLCIQMGLGR